MKALSTLSKIGTVWLNQGLSRSWLQDCAALLGTCIAMALQPGEVRGWWESVRLPPEWQQEGVCPLLLAQPLCAVGCLALGGFHVPC